MSTETPFSAAAASSATLQLNPMVDYLNSLRTQQKDVNATYVYEARAEFLRALRERAPWFPDSDALHAPTLLDRLANDLAEGTLTARMIFLTGDAGDGKTAFCAALAQALQHEGELEPVTTIGTFRIVKDASEISEATLRTHMLERLASSEHSTLVVAINEGRLRRLFQGMEAPAAKLWTDAIKPALDGWLTSEGAAVLDAAMREHKTYVLNFRLRFHVREVTPALLQRWTKPAVWEASPACSVCVARDRCPMLANARDLRDATIQERVSDVLAFCHFTGQRLPFRRLQAVLALAMTGGLRCRDVISGPLQDEVVAKLLRHRFYNALFLQKPEHRPVDVRPEPIARAFAPADAGRFVDLKRDAEVDDRIRRETIDGDPPPLGQLEVAAASALRNRLAPSSSGEVVGQLSEDLADLTRSLRRYLSFMDGPPDGLSWRRTLALVEDAAGDAKLADELRRRVVEALNRLHRMEEAKTETITGNQIDPAGFRTSARQVLELNLGTEFTASVVRGPELPASVKKYLESTPSEIHLEACTPFRRGEVARLRLDARLVDILRRVLDGYSSWHSLGPYRRDLARFHSHLMALAASAGQEPKLTIRAGARRYSVSTVGNKLRFEGQ